MKLRLLLLLVALLSSVLPVTWLGSSLYNRAAAYLSHLGPRSMGGMHPMSGVPEFGCLGQAFKALNVTEDHQKFRGSCLQYAADVQPELQFLDLLKPKSRSLPPAVPALGAHDWTGQILTRPTDWPHLNSSEGASQCPQAYDTIRVKIYKGILYASFPHDRPNTLYQKFWSNYRDIMFEMLITVLWLYKDVPDMDFAVQVTDKPVHCNWELPFLQFALFNMTSPSSGQDIDVDPKTYVCGSLPHSVHACQGYSRGFTLPVPDAWRQLAMSPGQLWAYSYCLHRRYLASIGLNSTGCLVPRKPVAFWRGSSTGLLKGWSNASRSHFAHRDGPVEARYFYDQFLNKRVRLAMLADRYPWMDVALTRLHAGDMYGYTDSPHNEQLARLFEAMLLGEPLDVEQWQQHHLVFDVEGHGPAFRLPRLFMGTVPVVHVETIQRDWFIDRAVPGVHYEAVRYDLSDVVERTRLLTQEAARDSSRLEAMALAATQLGVELFNGLAQVESVAWSLARMKEACAWEVRPPEDAVTGVPSNMTGEPGWFLLKLRRDRPWQAPFLHSVRDSIMQAQHLNFADAVQPGKQNLGSHHVEGKAPHETWQSIRAEQHWSAQWPEGHDGNNRDKGHGHRTWRGRH